MSSAAGIRRSKARLGMRPAKNEIIVHRTAGLKSAERVAIYDSEMTPNSIIHHIYHI